MIKVLVESPFMGKGDTDAEITADREANITYARRCLNDCFQRGEAPFASHLLYPQPDILDDDVFSERQLGIEAGLLWGREARKTVVYLDRGFSSGMAQGVERALLRNRDFELRTHPDYTAESTIIEAFQAFVAYKQWDKIVPSASNDAPYWMDHLHSELMDAARSSDMDVVPFLRMLHERSWFAG